MTSKRVREILKEVQDLKKEIRENLSSSNKQKYIDDIEEIITDLSEYVDDLPISTVTDKKFKYRATRTLHDLDKLIEQVKNKKEIRVTKKPIGTTESGKIVYAPRKIVKTQRAKKMTKKPIGSTESGKIVYASRKIVKTPKEKKLVEEISKESHPTDVRAVEFDINLYTPSRARTWLKRHGYEPIKNVHKTDKYLHYRISEIQHTENMHTIHAGDGVQIISQVI